MVKFISGRQKKGHLKCRMPETGVSTIDWVAVKELHLSYYIGENLLFTIYIYTHYGKITSSSLTASKLRVLGVRSIVQC